MSRQDVERYLDAKYSRWISTDPALSKYVSKDYDGSSGGIYNSINLNLYHYSGNNPVTYRDPDGNDFFSVAKSFVNGAKDGLVKDAKGIWNAGKALLNDPKQVATDVFNNIKSEVEDIISDPKGYALDKVEGVKQFAEDFMATSPEERAYMAGEAVEKIGVTVVAAKGASKVVSKLKAAGKVSSAASSAKAKPPMGACFIAGTLISTETGLLPIERINEGDCVYAYDEENNSVNLNRVVRTFVREETTIVAIKLSDSEIVTTTEHPFWVKGKGWVAASKLQKNDNLWTIENEFIPVLSVEIKTLDNPVLVYNFEVEYAHSYFVSEEKILVHNSCSAKNSYRQKSMYFGENKSFGNNTYHRKMKQTILSQSGDYKKIVGKNPDITISKGEIVLQGTGDFKGKSFKTGLSIDDF